ARIGRRLRTRAHSRGARQVPRELVPLSRLLGRRRNGRIVLRSQHHAGPPDGAVPVLGPPLSDLHPPAASPRVPAPGLPRPRLVNERQLEHEDGDGYYIRGGIVVVPKGGIIKPGTVV